ncbi:MAG: oligopeptidase B [Cyclobacteriaceae bacterium]|jgi:oligopeptidase B
MIKAPTAKKIAKEIITHGHSRIDNYFWMRLSDEQKEAESPDQQTSDVLAYLNTENDYLKSLMKPTEDLQDSLYQEIVSRIKQDDESVPVTVNGYSYYSRYEEGQDYPLHCRKKIDSELNEEVMLDGPKMGKNQDYFAIGSRTISENNKLLAYSTDLVSRRQYTIHIKNLETGDLLSDSIANTSGSITWANDNKTIFYTKKDPVTLRSFQIYSHVIGTEVTEDKLVFEETDETFSCGIFKTKSREYLMIGSRQTLSTEYRYLDANNPEGKWKTIQPRENELEYSVDHFEDDFYIVTNLEAKNFRLMKTSIQNTGKNNWNEVIPHRSNVLLEGIDIFQNHLVVSERKNGLNQLLVKKWEDNSEHYIEFNDPAYSASTFANPEFNTETLRFNYTSLTTPNTVYDYNLNSKDRKQMKQQAVLGGKFSPEDYASERLTATARDGAQVPISMVYKKGTELNSDTPLLLYAYGSYGYSMDPSFSSVRLSLLDRGFIYAIAHIRGGQEMGRQWYEDGKLLKKKNTFNDFIDCGKHLIAKKYTSAEHLYAQGGSAGGLLVGAIVNMEPTLWNGIIAAVPFVDVVSTMLDETIPLTTFEFDEWGNPKEKESYDYMLSFSPYDNVEKKNYPNSLITTGYWDSQVQYWEPAKWIAKLRDYKTDDNLLIMRCNMDVGHGGASGRFQRYKETALEYAFLLDLENIKQ